MNTKINNRFEREQLIDKGKKIIADAQGAGRGLTKSEREDSEALLASVRAFDARQDKFTKDFDAWSATVASQGYDFDEDDDRRGGLFTDAEKAGFVHAVQSKTAFACTVPLSARRLKAPMSSTSLGLPGVGTEVVAAQSPLSSYALRDLFTAAQAGGPVVRWYTLGNPDLTDVAIVPEGGLKPESEVVYAPWTPSW